jgi:hypothetical protein
VLYARVAIKGGGCTSTLFDLSANVTVCGFCDPNPIDLVVSIRLVLSLFAGFGLLPCTIHPPRSASNLTETPNNYSLVALTQDRCRLLWLLLGSVHTHGDRPLFFQFLISTVTPALSAQYSVLTRFHKFVFIVTRYRGINLKKAAANYRRSYNN